MLRDFLVALSAKDCSILLCFTPAADNGAALWSAEGDGQSARDFDDGTVSACRVPLRGREYNCRVAVVDTDIRPVSRVPKYYLEEKKILLAAAAAAEAGAAAEERRGAAPSSSLSADYSSASAAASSAATAAARDSSSAAEERTHDFA